MFLTNKSGQQKLPIICQHANMLYKTDTINHQICSWPSSLNIFLRVKWFKGLHPLRLTWRIGYDSFTRFPLHFPDVLAIRIIWFSRHRPLVQEKIVKLASSTIWLHQMQRILKPWKWHELKLLTSYPTRILVLLLHRLFEFFLIVPYCCCMAIERRFIIWFSQKALNRQQDSSNLVCRGPFILKNI